MDLDDAAVDDDVRHVAVDGLLCLAAGYCVVRLQCTVKGPFVEFADARP